MIHWPCAQKNIGAFDNLQPFENVVNVECDFAKTWKGMEECVRLGLAKSIGISNFNKKQIQRILDIATVKPVMNQVSMHYIPFSKSLRLII